MVMRKCFEVVSDVGDGLGNVIGRVVAFENQFVVDLKNTCTVRLVETRKKLCHCEFQYVRSASLQNGIENLSSSAEFFRRHGGIYARKIPSTTGKRGDITA